jgi:NadR type nicotinamide-nucleotide adenylyltransferase
MRKFFVKNNKFSAKYLRIPNFCSTFAPAKVMAKQIAMFKVGIIGPEASGKSTLAQYLAKRYKGMYIPEYARSYVEAKGTTEITWDELCLIAHHQIEQLQQLEQDHAQSDEVVFFDTELIITKVWFDEAFGRVPEWLNEAITRYPMDVYLLTCPDLPWTQDGARYNGSDEQRQRLFERYRTEIEALGIPYYVIEHKE